jgi:23S rRNA (uridine2552-2'-O)-methyltransferase
MSRWYKEKKKEYYYRKAKEEKYRSRAAYKLKQLNKKFNLIREGYTVVDLGAAPGGWTQVALELVGSKGLVVAVDREDIEDFDAENVRIIKGDFTDNETVQEILSLADKADTIISDASPDISGVWDIDHFRSVELGRHALKIAGEILREGGNFLVKIFQGREVEEFYREVKDRFKFAKRAKPPASRSSSAEIYIIGKGFKYQTSKE